MISTTKRLAEDFNRVRTQSPLVLNITNYVVMNNTANALLAIGASPVMAHAEDEQSDLVKIASAVVINMGTLDQSWLKSMLLSGRLAKEYNKPLVFDPVGAGASSFRTASALEIIKSTSPTVIRGNGSEILALVNASAKTKGVDSTISSDKALDGAKELARQTGAIVVISGEQDYITNGEEVRIVYNGSTMMPKVTGMGCTATALIGAFVSVNADPFEASYHAMCIMGIAGERAAAYSKGSGSLQLNFLDELCTLNEASLAEMFKAE